METLVKNQLIKYSAIIIIVGIILYKLQKYFEKSKEEKIKRGTEAGKVYAKNLFSSVPSRTTIKKDFDEAKKNGYSTKRNYSIEKNEYTLFGRGLKKYLETRQFEKVLEIFNSMKSFADHYYLNMFFLTPELRGQNLNLKMWILEFLPKEYIDKLNLQSEKFGFLY